VELIKGKEKQYSFELAYVLHRQGKNKEALKAIKKCSNHNDIKVKHLLSQIQYKLTDYKASVNIYQELI